mgnify:FL=1
MVDSGEGRDTDPEERRLVRRGAAEFIGMERSALHRKLKSLGMRNEDRQ